MRPTLASSALIVTLGALVLSCSSIGPFNEHEPVHDGEYDSEFPIQPTSKYLARIAESVLRINSVVYYRTYFFGDNEHITRAMLSDELLQARELEAVYNSNSTSGTAVVLFSSGNKIALLTCAHLASFPDTLYAYAIGPDRHATQYLSSVSVRQRVDLYVATLPEGGVLDLLCIDKEHDLAVVGKTFGSFQPMVPQSISYPLGKAGDLGWGTFLYLFGYPAGNKIVTRGIVSGPNRDRQQSFIVDAVFGRGFSGGICVALRDGVPHFEIVGMIKSVPAHMSYVLTPGRENTGDDLDLSRPYQGKMYVDREVDIEYGTSQAVSAETIRQFLSDHRSEIVDGGYQIDALLKN